MKSKSDMTCQNAARMIPDFIEDKLEIQEIEELMKHIDHCGSCKEELSIQFLIHAGLIELEDGKSFNLQSELDETLENAHRKIKMHHFIRESIIFVEVIGIIALLVVSILLIR
jgi:hypothetical protein